MTSRQDYELVREYNNTISFNANRKQLSEALVAYNKACELKIANSFTYGAMLNAYIRCGEVDEASILFKKLLNKEISKNFKPDVILYTTMIKGYCSIFDITSASELFFKMIDRSVLPNIRTLNTLLRGIALVGDVDELLKVYKKATELSIPLDSSSYEIIINMWSQSMIFDKIYPLLGRIKRLDRVQSGLPWLYYYISRGAAWYGDWKRAQKLLQESTAYMKTLPALTEQQVTHVTQPCTDQSAESSTLQQEVIGGKRAWKEIDDTRQESLEYYTQHKKEEYELIVDKLHTYINHQKIAYTVINHLMNVLYSCMHVYLFPWNIHTTSPSLSDIHVHTHDNSSSQSTCTIQTLRDHLYHSIVKSYGIQIILDKLKSLSTNITTTTTTNKITHAVPPSSSNSKKQHDMHISDTITDKDSSGKKHKQKKKNEINGNVQGEKDISLSSLSPSMASTSDEKGLNHDTITIDTIKQHYDNILTNYGLLCFDHMFTNIKNTLYTLNSPSLELSESINTTGNTVISDTNDSSQQPNNDVKKKKKDKKIHTELVSSKNTQQQQQQQQQQKRPIKMEICSGTGDWVVAQAEADPDSNWLALELRNDRVYNIFTKMLMTHITNLCLLRGDAMHILTYIPHQSIDIICVNYPEPPQRTNGKYTTSEAKHLLSKEFFHLISRLLKGNGRFTILTDNEWYAKFLSKIINDEIKHASLPLISLSHTDAVCRQNKVYDKTSRVTIFSGLPGSELGHISDASSYFDRLWKKGKMTDRYFIVLKPK